MPVKFKDYYRILGITRNVTKIDIQKAFRKKARQFHPDLFSAPQAEELFKEINEAYEVLKDETRRRKYNEIYDGLKFKQTFRKPPDWSTPKPDFRSTPRPDYRRPESSESRESSWEPQTYQERTKSGFSDFFEFLFGIPQSFKRSKPGQDIEIELELTLEEVYHGATKIIEVHIQDSEHGIGSYVRKERFEFKIPPGIKDGSRVRFNGFGGRGLGRGENGDLILRIKLAKHPKFTVQDYDLEMLLPVTPWQAALGGQITVPTLDGPFHGRLPPGSDSGKIFRVRGKGFLKENRMRGNLNVRIMITVPKRLSRQEKQAYEQLAKLYFPSS